MDFYFQHKTDTAALWFHLTFELETMYSNSHLIMQIAIHTATLTFITMPQGRHLGLPNICGMFCMLSLWLNFALKNVP